MHYEHSLAAQKRSRSNFQSFDEFNMTDGEWSDADVLDEYEPYDDYDFETSDYIQSIDALSREP